MMKVNDFLKYDITLKIDYDDYFRLIYETKYLIEARLGPNRTFIATKPVYGNSRKKAVKWFKVFYFLRDSMFASLCQKRCHNSKNKAQPRQRKLFTL